MLKKYAPVLTIMVSCLFFAYLYMVVTPFGETHGFFSEAGLPPQEGAFQYALMTVPFLVGYICYIGIIFPKIYFLGTINYPLILLTFFYGCFMSSLVFAGGAMIWIVIILSPALLILLFGGILFGVAKDCKYISACYQKKYPKRVS